MDWEVSKLLQQLIQIPSVNPEDDTTGLSKEQIGEKKIGIFVGKLLEKLGASIYLEEIEGFPNRPNVIGKFPSNSDGKPRILFGPHLDTVCVCGMEIDPFSGELNEKKIWGRGASDTKGSMAAMLTAFAKFGAHRISKLPYEIHFVGFTGEETAQRGSIDFANKHKEEYVLAIIGEPTMCKVVNRHKGCSWVNIKVEGRACHGSTPENGENAISKMCDYLARLEESFLPYLKSLGGNEAGLGECTMNIGIIEGGNRANIVPDKCKCTLDFRTTSQFEENHNMIEVLKDWVRENEMDFTVELIGDSAPSLNTSSDLELVKKLADSGKGVTTAPWFCDASRLSSIGNIPAVATGPGSIDQAHTKDEFIKIEDLEEGVSLYFNFLESLENI